MGRLGQEALDQLLQLLLQAEREMVEVTAWMSKCIEGVLQVLCLRCRPPYRGYDGCCMDPCWRPACLRGVRGQGLAHRELGGVQGCAE